MLLVLLNGWRWLVRRPSPGPEQLTLCLPPRHQHTQTQSNSFSEPHVTPGTVKIVRGEGMPLQKKPSEKGNLKVRTRMRVLVGGGASNVEADAGSVCYCCVQCMWIVMS